MADETIIDWRKRQGIQSHTREVVVKSDKIPAGFADRLALLEEKCLAFASFGSAFDQLASRVSSLENKPAVVPANDAVAVPAAFGEQVAKVDEIRRRLGDLETGFLGVANNGSTAEDEDLTERMDMLEEGMAEAAALLRVISILERGQDALRRQVSVLNDQISDIAKGMKETSRLIKSA